MALAYLLVIAYASLQPFHGWRLPPEEVYGFLTAPWPRYITLADVLINVVAYAPLGFLISLGLRAQLRPSLAVLAGFTLATIFSVAMESLQMFLPMRIASNVDVLANGTGALIGALAAPLFSPSRIIGGRLLALRNRIFVAGALADTGILIASLWVVTHLNPLSQLFGTGNMRATFELPEYFFHTPGRFLSAEAAVVFFNLLALGLLLSVLVRESARSAIVIVGFIAAALLLKIAITAILGGPQGPFAWITPGVLLGFTSGAALLVGLCSLGRRNRVILAALCLLAALAAINLAPDNPYFTLPPQLASGRASHLLSFSAILRALSELWPFLALPYLAVVCFSKPGARHDRL